MKKIIKSWRQQSLEVLEGNIWPDEKEYPTGLVKRCHELRKVPVDKLTAGDLRTLIGQQIGLKFLLPIAIEILTNNILTEGDLYPGDLLEAILKVDQNSWKQNLKYKEQIIALTDIHRDKILNEGMNVSNFYIE